MTPARGAGVPGTDAAGAAAPLARSGNGRPPRPLDVLVVAPAGTVVRATARHPRAGVCRAELTLA